MNDTLTRLQALGWIALLWAAIYLPALGSLEIKGEEGRRILPAVAMIESGNWIVPQVGGEDYLSKPPLINWLVAAGFKLSGTHSEWAARLPSAFCALLLGWTAAWTLASWLTPAGAFLAATFILTNIGLMEKGRLAEIEGLYISLSGIALLIWIGAWRRGANAWLTWTLPWVFLGLGLLAKGPLHLVFFYVFVVAVLWRVGRLRDLWNWPHLVGLLLMLGIFAAWAVPYLQMTSASRVGERWSAQFGGRMEVNEGFRFSNWILNIPRGLANFVPWVVLLPLLWGRRVASIPDEWPPEDRAILRGGRLAVAGCFLVVSLLPGGLPRYTLPLLVPASALLALVCTRDWETACLPAWLPVAWARTVLVTLALTLLGAVAAIFLAGSYAWVLAIGIVAGVGIGLRTGGKRLGQNRGNALSLAELYPAPQLALASMVAMAAVTFDYALGAVPRLKQAENVRPLAEEINRATADVSDPVCVLAPGFLPFLFYLRQSPRYVRSAEETPESARYLLLREKESPPAIQQLAQRGFHSQTALQVKDKNRGNWLLLRLSKPAEGRL